MPMRATTVRFSEALWSLVEQEAGRDGVSAAQYVRDAAVLRTAYAMGRRGDSDFEDAIARVSGAREPGSPEPFDETRRRRALLDAAQAVGDGQRLEALEATGLLDSDVSPSFDRLARLNLAGGHIALIALNAAFVAAQEKSDVTMPLILDAARNEFRKIERPIHEPDFRWPPTSVRVA